MKTLTEFRNKKIDRLLESGKSTRIIDTLMLIALIVLLCPIPAMLVYMLTLDRELNQHEITVFMITCMVCLLLSVILSFQLFFHHSVEKGVSEAKLLKMLQHHQESSFHQEAMSNQRYNETIDDIQKKVHLLTKINNSEDYDRQQKLDMLINNLEETYVTNAKKIPEYTSNRFIDAIIFKITSDHPDIYLTWRGKVPDDLKFTEYELSTLFYIPLNLAFENAGDDGCHDIVAEIRFSGTTMYLLIMQKDSFNMDKWEMEDDNVPSNMPYEQQYEIRILYSLLKRREAFFSVYSKDGAGFCEVIVPSSCASVQAPFTS